MGLEALRWVISMPCGKSDLPRGRAGPLEEGRRRGEKKNKNVRHAGARCEPDLAPHRTQEYLKGQINNDDRIKSGPDQQHDQRHRLEKSQVVRWCRSSV